MVTGSHMLNHIEFFIITALFTDVHTAWCLRRGDAACIFRVLILRAKPATESMEEQGGVCARSNLHYLWQR